MPSQGTALRGRGARRLLGAVSVALLGGACGDSPLRAVEQAALEEMALPALPASPTNAYADDPAAARLGKQLFFDPRFSGPLQIGDDGENGGAGQEGEPGQIACVSCHDLARGGADVRSRGNTSLGSLWTGRNAPTVLNAAYSMWQFWDGRSDSLWSQALQPLEKPSEHNFTRLEVAHLLHDHYRAPYEDIFGALPDLDDEVRFPPAGRPGDPAYDGMSEADRASVDEVFASFGKAIEAYERLLVDTSSPFDRYLQGDVDAMSPAAVRGAKLFVGRAACNECHHGPLLAHGFHNHGVAQRGPHLPVSDEGRALGIPLVLEDPFNGAGPFSDDRDAGAEMLKGLAVRPEHVGAFKTPTLRNVTKTAPYMHNGTFATLWDVLAWYREAAATDGFPGTLDSAVEPLRLSDNDLEDLVEFLRALEGDPLPEDVIAPPELP